MSGATFEQRRGQIETYFDRTASAAWARLTSDQKVSGIRATVRAGRDRMRATLLSYLDEDLSGRRVLDAGCGTGALAQVAASRGAEVLAIDLSPTLTDLARHRTMAVTPGTVTFRVGDMTDPSLGTFDHVVAMDSLIHYEPNDVLRILAAFAPRTRVSMLFTYAPRTPLLSAMHAVGKLFPRGDRSPAIVPISPRRLAAAITSSPELRGWKLAATHRVDSGFYISQAVALVRQ